MSRVGRLPISIPSDVQVSVVNGSVEVQGPKGQLVLDVHPVIRVRVEDGKFFAPVRPIKNPTGPSTGLRGR